MTNNIIFFTIAVFFVSVIIFLISKKIINGAFKRISKKTKTNFDDILIKNKFPVYTSFLIPTIFIYLSISKIFEDYNSFSLGISKFIEFTFILISILIVRSFLFTLRIIPKVILNLKINLLIVMFRYF